MKRIAKLFVFCCCLAALFALSSCQKNEKLILGTWDLTTITLDGNEVSMSLLGDLQVAFKESGSYAIDFEISPLVSMLVEGVYESYPDIFGEGIGSAAMLMSMLDNLDGMTGTYTIDKEQFSMTFFISSISGDIVVLDKEQFGFSSSSNGVPVAYTFTKQ